MSLVGADQSKLSSHSIPKVNSPLTQQPVQQFNGANQMPK